MIRIHDSLVDFAIGKAISLRERIFEFILSHQIITGIRIRVLAATGFDMEIMHLCIMTHEVMDIIRGS